MTPCRLCGSPLTVESCDFGAQPLANRFVPMDAPDAPDPAFPLRVMVCSTCLLVQLDQAADPAAMFVDYNYLSSVSSYWLNHAADFARMALDRFPLSSTSLVMEVGSNDGCLLHEFAARGIPVLGIDPAANIAAEARRRGIPTLTAFFGEETAAALLRDGKQADLLIANNVLAHVPTITGFVHGLARILAPAGVLSIEVPHVLDMLRDAQFDTVYHEHVFYFSAFALRQVLAAAGLAVFDIVPQATHGGSLRVLAQHAATGIHPTTSSIETIIAAELTAGLHQPRTYRALAEAAKSVVGGLRQFLDQAAGEGRTVAAYGAAAKGTMLLNAAHVRPSEIQFIADANPLKQGHRIPGCRIPVVSPEQLKRTRPDYLLILPWNIGGEIMTATRFIGDWGGRFVIPSPTLHVLTP